MIFVKREAPDPGPLFNEMAQGTFLRERGQRTVYIWRIGTNVGSATIEVQSGLTF